MTGYDPALDPVHGSGWNSAARWGGWDWREPSRGEHFRTCSFCGSIHPEDLAAETAGGPACRTCGQGGWYAHFTAMTRANPGDPRGDHPYDPGGWWPSWADRKYGWPHKFYVEGLANRDPAGLFVISSQSGGDPGQQPIHGGGIEWVRWDKMSRAQRRIAKRDGHDRRDHHPNWVGFGTRPTHHAKFYTIHLADPRVPDEARETVQRVSGLRFTFTDDGRVSWQGYAPPVESSAPGSGA